MASKLSSFLDNTLKEVMNFLQEKNIQFLGLALTGSVAKEEDHTESDYDIIILSNISSSIHIENFYLYNKNIQLIILPIQSIDNFLLLNYIAGNGIMYSTLQTLHCIRNDVFFKRLQKNFDFNLMLMEKIEIITFNKNLSRLRKRITKLITDLKNSQNEYEDLYTAGELVKSLGQFSLSKKSRFFLPTDKHLFKEMSKFYGDTEAKELMNYYRNAVITKNYQQLIEYSIENILEGNIIAVSSSSDSYIDNLSSLSFGIIYVNSYYKPLLLKIFEFIKGYDPQIVLNQNGDLLHVGYYFIVKSDLYTNLLKDFGKLGLSTSESRLITLNYQMDVFLLHKYQFYNENDLLLKMSKFSIKNYGDRNIVLNTALDWVIYTAIILFRKDEFKKYLSKCSVLYKNSIFFAANGVDLNRIKIENCKIHYHIEKMDVVGLKLRYQKNLEQWQAENIFENELNDEIVSVFHATLSKSLKHSIFEEKCEAFSCYFYLFESIFESLMLKHEDRGLIYLISEILIKNV